MFYNFVQLYLPTIINAQVQMTQNLFGNMLKARNKSPNNVQQKHLSLKELMNNYETCPNNEYILNFCFASDLPRSSLENQSETGRSQLNIEGSALLNIESCRKSNLENWSSINEYNDEQKENLAIKSLEQGFQVHESSLCRENERRVFAKQKKPRVEDKNKQKKQTEKLIEKIDNFQQKFNQKAQDLGERIKRAQEKLKKMKSPSEQGKNQKQEQKKNPLINFSFEDGVYTLNVPEEHQGIMLQDVQEIVSEHYQSLRRENSGTQEPICWPEHPEFIINRINIVESILKKEYDTQNKNNDWFRNYISG